MRYAGIESNDVVNGEGICVSFWCQGCPHHCPGCFNKETWDYEGGQEAPNDIKGQIVKLISENGIQRNFSILGGEPLCPQNMENVLDILTAVRIAYPHIKIFLWTGYQYEFLINSNPTISAILDKIDVLIDGPFDMDKKDLTLKLRGSSNQRIFRKNEKGKLKICNY